jgi:hypothetical protein
MGGSERCATDTLRKSGRPTDESGIETGVREVPSMRLASHSADSERRQSADAGPVEQAYKRCGNPAEERRLGSTSRTYELSERLP